MTQRLPFFLALFALITLSACGDDEDPNVTNEGEVITAVTLTLFPNGPHEQVALTWQDADGSGGNPPVTTVVGNLTANSNYRGQVSFTSGNQLIDAEILDEGADHQIFYETDGLGWTLQYSDADEFGAPLGIMTNVQTADAGTGNLTVTLRHEPTKTPAVAIDNPDAAGGSIDAAVTWTGLTVR